MKWMKDSLSLVKCSAIATAVFTMVTAPLAQGAQAVNNAKAKVKAASELNYDVNAKSVQEYLKFTGLNNGKRAVTVGEFYSKMRPYYPKTLQRQMDRWARENRSEIMPEFEASTFKDSDGKERVRLLISKDGQTVTATFNPESDAKFVKVNNVFLTKKDMSYHDQVFAKLYHGDKAIKKLVDMPPKGKIEKDSVALSYEEFKRLTPVQRAEYFVRLRYVMENAQAVMESYYGKQALNQYNKDFYVKWMLGEEANAAGTVRGAKAGDPCIVAGYRSVYGENFSCGGEVKGMNQLKKQMAQYGGGSCQSGTISCNPYVYGFKSGAPGQPFCVSRANVSGSVRDATSKFCEMQSPLRKGSKFETEDKKRIIESWMAAKGTKIDLLFDKDGKLSEKQFDMVKDYMNGLNEYVKQATVTCQTAPLSDIKTVRDEQASACTALSARMIDLQTYPDLAGGGVPPGDDCSVTKPGSQKEGNSCVCPVGTSEGDVKEEGNTKRGCIAPIGVLKDEKKECAKDEKRDEKTGECVAMCAFWCKYGKWVLGGAAAVGVIGLIALLNRDKDDDDDDNKNTVVDRCPAPPLPCTPPVVPPTATVTPPPVVPPPTVTPPPTVPTPAVTPFVESTTEVPTSSSGGVR